MATIHVIRRILIVKTSHDIFQICNLEKIWVQNIFFVHRLVYKDENGKFCIFWSFSKSTLENIKKKIEKEYYDEEESILEL